MSACGAREQNTRVVPAGVQMRKLANVVSHHGAADAGMVGPAAHARFEEGAIDDQLTSAVE